MAAKRKPNKLVLAVVAVVHIAVTALTWRDLRERPDALLRGKRKFWRVATAMNTSWSAAYWLFGRRRSPAG